MNHTDPTAETARLHDVILEREAEIAALRDLLGKENQRANAAIDREETAEQAALEARQELDAVRAAASAVVSPPTDRAALRDRIADALLDHLSRTADIRPSKTGDLAFMPEITDPERQRLADAVLAVLGEQADRAEVLNAAAQHLYTALFPAVYADMGQKAAEGVNRAVSELRRLAVEAHDTGTQQPGDADATEADIDRMMAAGVPVQIVTRPPDTRGAGAQQPVPASRLSGQHADALWDAIAPPGPDRPSYPVQHERVCRVVADIVNDVTAGGGAQQPDTEAPTADRPAVLREIATTLDQLAETDVIRKRRSLATARRLLAVELRRMADDVPAPVAQQPAADSEETHRA